MGNKKITIADIAREAKVGIGTVSRVLNNSLHVSEETRKKVLEVVKKRQYTPSGAASRLARQEDGPPTVGLLLPDIGNHYFFEIFETIYGTLRNLGIDLIIFNYERHNPTLIRKILDAQVSALLIFAFKLDRTEVELLNSRNVRSLYIDYHEKGESCIVVDNVYGGELAARYFVEKGVKNPCYVQGKPAESPNEKRLRGFTSYLYSHGYKEIPIYESTLNEKEAYQVGLEIANSSDHDGVFCYCDDIAVGVIQAVRDSNKEIRVVGFDGLRATRYLKLSTVSQQPSTIGERAAKMVVELMEHEGEPKAIVEEFKPVLLDRNS